MKFMQICNTQSDIELLGDKSVEEGAIRVPEDDEVAEIVVNKSRNMTLITIPVLLSSTYDSMLLRWCLFFVLVVCDRVSPYLTPNLKVTLFLEWLSHFFTCSWNDPLLKTFGSFSLL